MEPKTMVQDNKLQTVTCSPKFRTPLLSHATRPIAVTLFFISTRRLSNSLLKQRKQHTLQKHTMKFTAASMLVLLGLTTLHASPVPGKKVSTDNYPRSQDHMNDNLELVKQCGRQVYWERYDSPPPPPWDKRLTSEMIGLVHIYNGCKLGINGYAKTQVECAEKCQKSENLASACTHGCYLGLTMAPQHHSVS